MSISTLQPHARTLCTNTIWNRPSHGHCAKFAKRWKFEFKYEIAIGCAIGLWCVCLWTLKMCRFVVLGYRSSLGSLSLQFANSFLLAIDQLIPVNENHCAILACNKITSIQHTTVCDVEHRLEKLTSQCIQFEKQNSKRTTFFFGSSEFLDDNNKFYRDCIRYDNYEYWSSINLEHIGQ